MAEGLNRVFCMGNLGQDPELRVTQGGQSILTLRVACSETYLDRNRVRQERTEWIRCVIWGRRAEALSKFLRKGSRVTVEGSLRTSSYEDRDGNKRYSTEVVAKNIFVSGSNNPRNQQKDPERKGPSRRDDDDGGYPVGGGDGGGYDNQDYGSGGGYGDDDIPF